MIPNKDHYNFPDWCQVDESIKLKSAQPTSSGYFDELQCPKQFPELTEYHFRIEDDKQILELERLQRQSHDYDTGDIFKHSSDEFKSRLGALIASLDNNMKHFANSDCLETHGYYYLADVFEQPEIYTRQQFEQSDVQIQQLQQKVARISFEDTRSHLSRRIPQQNHMSEQVIGLSSKFNRITISDNDL